MLRCVAAIHSIVSAVARFGRFRALRPAWDRCATGLWQWWRGGAGIPSELGLLGCRRAFRPEGGAGSKETLPDEQGGLLALGPVKLSGAGVKDATA
ncbi:hypothetical protein ACWDRZ_32815, partial [Streptomyces sp. NPDC003509]